MFLVRCSVFDPAPWGFRSGYSCETQLIVTLSDLLQSYDQNKQIDVVILDFSKAFDTVPHDKLMYKLEKYRIKGDLDKLLTSNNKGPGTVPCGTPDFTTALLDCSPSMTTLISLLVRNDVSNLSRSPFIRYFSSLYISLSWGTVSTTVAYTGNIQTYSYAPEKVKHSYIFKPWIQIRILMWDTTDCDFKRSTTIIRPKQANWCGNTWFFKGIWTVPHDKLILHKWLTSFLTKRDTRVVIETSPFLHTGATFALSQSSESSPQSINFCNIFVIPGARALAHVFCTMFDIWSGPMACDKLMW
jgi:hypothetical protein